MSDIKKQFTTVTPLSKIIAAVLFIILPLLGFAAGLTLGQTIEKGSIIKVNTANVMTTTTSSVSTTTSSGPSIRTSKAVTNPYTGWKTYKSSVYGYSVQYPPEYDVADRGDFATLKRVIIGEKKIINDYLTMKNVTGAGPNGSPGEYLNITVTDQKTGMQEIPKTSGSYTVTEKSFVIDGKNGKEYVRSNSKEKLYESIKQVHVDLGVDNYYIFTLYADSILTDPQPNPEYQNVTKILNTFIFK